jgi:hypothetical protein
MVVLLSGQGIDATVSNKFGKCTASCVKPKTDGNVGMDLEVPINSLGSTNNLALASLRLEIFSQ